MSRFVIVKSELLIIKDGGLNNFAANTRELFTLINFSLVGKLGQIAENFEIYEIRVNRN